MTEKRFDYSYYDDGTESIYDREEDEYYFNIDLDKIGEILNDLHDENQRLLKMLDNVANAMQKQNKDVPLDYFVEWWNKIATEGLDD